MTSGGRNIKYDHHDQSWKVLNTTLRRAELRNRRCQRIPSFDEFIAEKKRSHEIIPDSEKSPSPGYFKSKPDGIFGSTSKPKLNPTEAKWIPPDNSEDEWASISESNSDSDGANPIRQKGETPLGVQHAESSDESSSDEELNAFLKDLAETLKADEDSDIDTQHYNNLTDYMRKVDERERSSRSEKPTIPTNQEEYLLHNNLQLSLEQKLPVLQVLDTIGDINKIIKAGKLTPRMERIMEYKQDHPFEFGYEEEELGCCPWLVYKCEQMYKRFFASQWPFNGMEIYKNYR